MQKNTDEKIIGFLTKHLFSSIYQIKSVGIIKNYYSLKNRLDSLEEQNLIKYVKFWDRYYASPLPDYLFMFGIIVDCADRIFELLRKNKNLRRGSFYKEVKKTFEKIQELNGTKDYKNRRFLNELSNGIENIKEINERCLLRWFLSIELKTMIWKLEFKKLQKFPFASIDDTKLIESMLCPLACFENFLIHYDPQNTKTILGTSYESLENSLNQIYNDDLSYYKLLKSNKTPLNIKIWYNIDFLLRNSKKDASEAYFFMKKQFSGYEERIRKNVYKKRDQYVEDSLEPIVSNLTAKMKVEKKKAKNDKSKKDIQKRFSAQYKKERDNIIQNVTPKYQKKFEKECSRTTPKNTKSITHMIRSLQNSKGELDYEKILDAQRIESNRLYCQYVSDSVLSLFLDLYIRRYILNQIPRHDPYYQKVARKIKKKIPEFVIS